MHRGLPVKSILPPEDRPAQIRPYPRLNDAQAAIFAREVTAGKKPPVAFEIAFANDPLAGELSLADRKRCALSTMKRPNVQALIAEYQAPVIAGVRITLEDLLRTFVAQGTFDPLVFAGVTSLDKLGELVDEPTRRMLVTGWKYDRRGNFLVTLVSKTDALDKLARHLSFYNDVVKLDLGPYAARLAAARRARDDG